MGTVGSRSMRCTAALGLGLSLASACDNSAKDKAQADEIARKAEESIAKIQSEATEKIATAQKKIDELQTLLIEAGAQAKAQAEDEEEKLAAAATDALKKARAAYKESERRELTSLLKDLDDVRAKAQSAPPKLKTQIDQAMKDIAPKKEAVKKEIEALDTATLETLKTVKAKADQALTSLKQAILSAQAKLK